MGKLVLVRHGQSQWNLENRFTGWVDVPITPLGEEEAHRAGRELKGIHFDLAFTSVLQRAQQTLKIILDELGQPDLPTEKDQALNERHYGDLQGKDKKAIRDQYGDEQFMRWRRSYDVPPPPLTVGSEWDVSGDPRYAGLAPEVVPLTECLADVVARLLPYWYDVIVPDLRAGHVVLVAAHGNSLRAMVKHLDGLTEQQVVGLNIPTGIPLRYELDDDLRPRTVGGDYLDPAAAATAAAAVADQGK